MGSWRRSAHRSRGPRHLLRSPNRYRSRLRPRGPACGAGPWAARHPSPPVKSPRCLRASMSTAQAALIWIKSAVGPNFDNVDRYLGHGTSEPDAPMAGAACAPLAERPQVFCARPATGVSTRPQPIGLMWRKRAAARTVKITAAPARREGPDCAACSMQHASDSRLRLR